jgi:hypothetical protein
MTAQFFQSAIDKVLSLLESSFINVVSGFSRTPASDAVSAFTRTLASGRTVYNQCCRPFGAAPVPAYGGWSQTV